jgi:hypothetical protein
LIKEFNSNKGGENPWGRRNGKKRRKRRKKKNGKKKNDSPFMKHLFSPFFLLQLILN